MSADGLRAQLSPAVRQVRDGRAWIAGAAGYVAGSDRGVRVSYGHFTLPSRDEPAVGGIVKLQSLSEVFPNTPFRYNVLYLVSSRLPEGAVIPARSLAMGSPAKVRRRLSDAEVASILDYSGSYVRYRLDYMNAEDDQ